jgi:hypothetical protein
MTGGRERRGLGAAALWDAAARMTGGWMAAARVAWRPAVTVLAGWVPKVTMRLLAVWRPGRSAGGGSVPGYLPPCGGCRQDWQTWPGSCLRQDAWPGRDVCGRGGYGAVAWVQAGQLGQVAADVLAVAVGLLGLRSDIHHPVGPGGVAGPGTRRSGRSSSGAGWSATGPVHGLVTVAFAGLESCKLPAAYRFEGEAGSEQAPACLAQWSRAAAGGTAPRRRCGTNADQCRPPIW